MASKCSAEHPVINCEAEVIKKRAKTWIDQIRIDNPKKLLLVSAMADATKVPPIGEFSHKYNAWVGGSFPNHCVNMVNYDQENIITNELATEIKVGMLSLQEGKDGVSPFKIISARPQSTNQRCDDYNYMIMNAVNGLNNVFCVSIAFDGLSTETEFIRTNLIAFMKGSSNIVAMTDCNHAAKNMRSQLVLGSTIVMAGEALFDVSILRIAGVSPELYKVNDYTSDIVVLKLCESDTIHKLIQLMENGGEDPLNVAFMAMSLYFLRMFLCAFNTVDITAEARVTMLWSSLMWFSSIEGIHDLSHNNFNTVCIGGIFLCMQKRVRNLRMTTTEPLEHMFGTARSWRREFTVNEFIIYSNKLEMIMNNVINNDMKMGTSSKGYMNGFAGFASAVKNLQEKLKKESFTGEQNDLAVEVDYSKSISTQIEPTLIEIIERTQKPIINLLKMFGIKKVSRYCEPISSILDICGIYQHATRDLRCHLLFVNQKINEDQRDEAGIIQQLADLAIDVDKSETVDDLSEQSNDTETFNVDSTYAFAKVDAKESVYFNLEMFYKFIRNDVNKENVSQMLHLMKESISSSFEKNRLKEA